MSEPHVALSIPELLQEILEHLSMEGLNTAALVCKAWLRPAVDTKWRTQNIKLSRLLSHLAPIERDGLLFALIPEPLITHDHWHRFLEQYANWITRLVLDMPLDEASIDLISALLERFGGQFGSNLISLNWSYETYIGDYTGGIIDLLPGTRLQEVDFHFNEQFYITGKNPLSQLAHRAPQISKLEGVFGSLDFSVFPRLQCLSHSGSLSTSDYHSLTYCRDLAVLFLQWTRVQIAPIHGTNTIFSRLEEFLLHRSEDEAEDMILQSVMPALCSFKYFRQDAVGPFTIPLLNNISLTSPLLENISFSIGVAPSQLELVQHDGVRSLSFGLYRLRSQLETENLTDLLKIGRAFPNLENLRVFFHWTARPHNRELTWHWHALPVLAEQLHHLQHLTIPLHVPTSSLSEIPKEIAPLRSLINLTFLALYIRQADIDPFVSYLAILFPNVQSIEVEVLSEVPDDWVVGMDLVPGNSRAFVDRFFDYRNRIRESQISEGDLIEEAH
ncbi:hypothetical protein FRB95_011700 [Tulasnella sp. JGI-2019a]|nr:hypothetical protein FRB95_011700 [Tulasnella sp. JGI-2019a]